MNKNRKYRTSAFIATLIITVVAVFANLIIQQLFATYPLKLDVSSSRLFSLSQSTTDLLNTLDTDINIIYLENSNIASSDTAATQYVPDETKKVIETYRNHSNGKIKIESIDPATSPEFVRQYPDLAMQYSSIIFALGDRAKEVKYNEWISFGKGGEKNYEYEGLFTNAIAYVINEDFPKVYFSIGHGEQGAESTAAYHIQNENYQTREVALLNQDIPEDCKILFIIAPSKDYSATEIDRLDKFLKNSGKVQIYFDATKASLPNLYSYLKEWGISVNDDIVIENAANKAISNPLGILPELESMAFTDKLIENKMAVVTPVSKSIDILPSNIKNAVVVPIMKTSNESFSKMNMESNTMSFTEGDIKGPRNLGVSSRAGENLDTKLLVYGSVQMVAQDFMNVQYGHANKDLLMNSVAWMEGNEKKIAIRPKPVVSNILIMNKLQGYLMTYSIIGIFVLLLAISIFIWYRRRYR